MATKPRGVGEKALVAGPLRKKTFFFAASLTENNLGTRLSIRMNRTAGQRTRG